MGLSSWAASGDGRGQLAGRLWEYIPRRGQITGWGRGSRAPPPPAGPAPAPVLRWGSVVPAGQSGCGPGALPCAAHPLPCTPALAGGPWGNPRRPLPLVFLVASAAPALSGASGRLMVSTVHGTRIPCLFRRRSEPEAGNSLALKWPSGTPVQLGAGGPAMRLSTPHHAPALWPSSLPWAGVCRQLWAGGSGASASSGGAAGSSSASRLRGAAALGHVWRVMSLSRRPWPHKLSVLKFLTFHSVPLPVFAFLGPRQQAAGKSALCNLADSENCFLEHWARPRSASPAPRRHPGAPGEPTAAPARLPRDPCQNSENTSVYSSVGHTEGKLFPRGCSGPTSSVASLGLGFSICHPGLWGADAGNGHPSCSLWPLFTASCPQGPGTTPGVRGPSSQHRASSRSFSLAHLGHPLGQAHGGGSSAGPGPRPPTLAQTQCHLARVWRCCRTPRRAARGGGGTAARGRARVPPASSPVGTGRQFPRGQGSGHRSGREGGC